MRRGEAAANVAVQVSPNPNSRYHIVFGRKILCVFSLHTHIWFILTICKKALRKVVNTTTSGMDKQRIVICCLICCLTCYNLPNFFG